MKYQNIREEELKNKVGQDFFADYDTTKIIGDIDFCVSLNSKLPHQKKLFEYNSLLWAEAKRGDYNLTSMFTQLVLTIGKARSFDKYLPPAFLGAFDSNKIAFVPYNSISDIFSLNDFNWNIPPSNYETKEFKLIAERIKELLVSNHYVYSFNNDEKELKYFIRHNIAKGTERGKILIDKNNFVPIYLRWLDQVKPCISFDWTEGRKQNILDSDFYLADLFVDDKGTSRIEDDTPLHNNLFVVFKNSHYVIAKENLKSLFNASIEFKDKTAYEQFWKKYKRPPIQEIQHYIVDRRDLLIPQDIRERKGAFFTPKRWVELSQRYIAELLGLDWQEEYFIWDCAAGTGNLLAGLTNKYNIWASTIDPADVNVMYDRIENGAILLKDHVFQFDFLNDEFSKLPLGLQRIIKDEEKRKKLIIYINPPYAETGSTKSKTSKSGVSNATMSHRKFFEKMNTFSKRELYAQFLMRIFVEIPNCRIANFSKLKNLQSSYFSEFREIFQAKLERIFLVPADTFDNVKGKFPIGFMLWNLSQKEKFENIYADVYTYNNEYIGKKRIFSYNNEKMLNDWLRPTWTTNEQVIAYLACNGNDFQNQNGIFIELNKKNNTSTYFKPITKDNLIQSSIYFAVRHCIDATWLNDRDQFLFPNAGWMEDKEFQSDCLAFTLFSNDIQSKSGVNYWIPFTEQDVNARDKFENNFMSQFIKGRIKTNQDSDLFNHAKIENSHWIFSDEATNVFNAGKALWKYYHAQPNANVNASLYDI